MIPSETPYKVLKYLSQFQKDTSIPIKYENTPFIIHLLERRYIKLSEVLKNKFAKNFTFNELYEQEISPIINKYSLFIGKHNITNIEGCSIQEIDNLILIDIDQPTELTLQELLAKYFHSSKYAQPDSIIANSIKKILQIEDFIEDEKDQQYLSILYPKNESRFIILCENKNRLRAPRHSFIEFWYVGGGNIRQLKFTPKPKIPVYYLCDWDFKGINIYLEIKNKYLPEIKAFVPENYQLLVEKQDDVKGHKSKWENDNCLKYLNEKESEIIKALYPYFVIEEQKILLTEENLLHNSIY